MSGDLEDFLKRAAQRRRERAAQQHSQQPKTRQRPEYTDRRAERAAYDQYDRYDQDDQETGDEPLVAEVLTDDDRLETAVQLHEAAEAETLKRQPPTAPESSTANHPPSPAKTPSPSNASGIAGGLPNAEVTPEELMAWMRNPAGLKQAILIREILDRPTHRWD